MQIKNPDHLECTQCWNESSFSIKGINRIGNTHEWDCLLECNQCFVSQNIRFTNFAFYQRLLKHIKSMISEQENKHSQLTSYAEWDLRSGKTFRDSHPQGQYQRIL